MIYGIVLFSGGRTSGFKEQYPDFRDRFVVFFCNTGKEAPETLDFVERTGKEFGVNIIWLEYYRIAASQIVPGIFPTAKRNANLAKQAANGETTHWYRVVDYKSASRKGEPFDELINWMENKLPNVVSRACSIQLKIRTVMRYLFSIGVTQYQPIIGIRKDEEIRTVSILASCDSFEHPKFPLVESGVTLKDVSAFWKSSALDLQLESYQGNCDFCFLKSKPKRIRIARERPDLTDWWYNHELKKASNVGNGKVFRLGEPVALIRQLAIQDSLQGELFDDAQDIPCTCVERAFQPDEG